MTEAVQKFVKYKCPGCGARQYNSRGLCRECYAVLKLASQLLRDSPRCPEYLRPGRIAHYQKLAAAELPLIPPVEEDPA